MRLSKPANLNFPLLTRPFLLLLLLLVSVAGEQLLRPLGLVGAPGDAPVVDGRPGLAARLRYAQPQPVVAGPHVKVRPRQCAGGRRKGPQDLATGGKCVKISLPGKLIRSL